MRNKDKNNLHKDKIQIWFRYFTDDWAKNANKILKDSKFEKIIRNFKSPSFDSSKIDGELYKENNEDIYADKFLLNDPIPLYYDELVNLISENSSNEAKESTTLLMQYEIIIMYQLPKLFQGLLSEKELSEKLASKFIPLLEIFSTYSKILPICDFVSILKPLYEFLSESFETAKYFPNAEFGYILIQSVLNSTLEFISSNNIFTYQEFQYLYDFIEDYVIFYATDDLESVWKNDTIQNFINLYTKFSSIDDSIFISINPSYLMNFYEKSFIVLDYIIDTVTETYDPQKFYLLIMGFIKFLNNSRNQKQISEFVCNSSNFNVIAKFLFWIVNYFPFTDTYFFEERGVEERIYFNNLQFKEINEDQFFIQSNQNYSENVNFDEYTNTFNNYINKINKDQRSIPSGNAKSFIDSIQGFESLSSGPNMFKGIISSIFNQLELLKDEDNGQKYVNTSLFTIFLVIKLLCSLHTNTTIFIFKGNDLLSKFFYAHVFSPDFLVNDLTLIEQDFIDDIRISFLSLIRSIYLKSEELRNQIKANLFTLINNRIIEGLPYLLAFMLVIQKNDKALAVDFLKENIFVTDFSNFLMKLDINGSYRKLVSSTIHIAFSFLMTFLDAQTTQIYFAQSPLFFKVLHNYFFIHEIHDIAILIYTRFIITKYDENILQMAFQQSNSIDSFSNNSTDKFNSLGKYNNSTETRQYMEIPYNYAISSFKEFLDQIINLHCDKDNDHKLIINLLNRVLSSVFPAIADNRTILFPILLKYDILQTIAHILEICKTEQEFKDFFQIITSFYNQLSFQFPNMRKSLTKTAFPIIINSFKSHLNQQSQNNFQIEDFEFFIKLLLSCVFETQLPNGVLKTQPKLDIMNPKLLPFIHELTKDTLLNEQIFKYIIKLCEQSINNKFQLFQSKMMSTIINYIVSFPQLPEENEQAKNCIFTMFSLFTIVSSLTIKSDTVYKALSFMKVDETKTRKWYSEYFIDSFTDILQAQFKNNIKSFIKHSDSSTGLKISSLPPSFVKSFTILFRFQLANSSSRKPVTFISIDMSNLFNIIVQYDHKRLSVTSVVKSQRYKVETDYELLPDIWYQLCLSINNQLIRLFINGEKVFHHTEPILSQATQQLNQGLFKSSNINTDKLEVSIMKHFSSTINVCYLFNQPFSDQIIESFAALPTDFISLFNQENYDEYIKHNKDSSLPTQLFSNSLIEKSTIACYNPRMSIGLLCQNLVQSSIGAATTSGQIIPYSYSFADIILRSGGPTLFLPLLSYTTVTNETNQELNEKYLNKVLNLLFMLLRNDNLANNFVENKGFMIMASILKSIGSDIITIPNIQPLLNIYNSLQSNCKIDMMKNIFLNLSVWNTFPEKNALIFSSFILNELNLDFETFSKSTSIGLLIAILNSEENDNIRKSIWCIIRDYARHSFTPADADDILLIAEIASNQKIQVEAVQSLNKIINDERNDFSQSSFINYKKIFSLFDSQDDKIFFITIQILTFLSRLKTVDFKQMLVHLSEIEVKAKISKQTILNLIKKIEKQEDGNMIYIFFALSTNIDKEIIYFFTEELLKIQNIGSLLVSLNIWYFWLAFFLFNSDKEVDFTSPEISPIIGLFSHSLAYLVKTNNKTSFSDFIGFFTFLQVNFELSTPYLIRKAFNNMFSLLLDKPTNQQQIMISTEILSFLFFIPSSEQYFYNIQLYSNENNQIIPNTSKNKTQMKLKEMISSDISIKTPNFQYSSRFNKNGVWEDIELAVWLVQYYILPTFNESSFIWYAEAKFLLSDLCAYLCGFISRASSEKISWSISTMTKILEMAPNESSFYIFSYDVIHAVYKNQQHFSQLQKFLNSNYKFSSKPFKFSSLEDVLSHQSFLQKCGENNVRFYDDFASLSNENRLDRIYKARNQRVCQLITFFRESINSQPQQYDREIITRSEFYAHTVSRQIIDCDKSLKSLRNTYSRNGGPWSRYDPLNPNQHFKISNIYDTRFRKILMKSNFNFDPFMYKDARTASKILNQPAVKYANSSNNNQDTTSNVLFTVYAQLITIETNCIGRLSITSNCEMFFDDSSTKSISFKAEDIEMILRRFYLHEDCAMEFFLVQRKSYLFAFSNKEDRKNVTKFLKARAVMPHLTVFQAETPYETLFEQQKFTYYWQNGKISTFEYLMYINLFAGRSLNDLTQYPVFPWVLKDFDSDILDLTNPNSFRDLSKPIGALNPELLQKMKEKYESTQETPRYAFMYSHPFAVVHYLIRTEPFTTAHIKLQGGFDDSSRMFTNVSDEWSMLMKSDSAFLELIPEFYYLPDFLYNRDGISECQDVVLPKWAKTPESFIESMKEALESTYVSEHINEWIDLIFGYKQKGEIALQNDNLFNPQFYLDWKTDDDVSKTIAETSGTIPVQLFDKPHPKRKVQPFLPAYKVIYKPVTNTRQFGLPSIFISLYSFNSTTSILYILSNLTVIVGTKAIKQLQCKGKPQFMVYKDYLLMISDLDNSVNCYKISDELTLKNVIHFSNALTVSLSPAGDNAIVLLRDSSINIIDLSTFTISFTFTPNFSSIIGISVSYESGFIATIDKTQKVNISNLYTGKIVQYFFVDSSDTTNSILIIGNDIILRKESSFTLVKMNGTKINEYNSNTPIIHLFANETYSGIVFICIVQIDGTVTILSIPTLDVITKINIGQAISAITFVKEAGLFIVSDCNGQISNFHFC